MKSSPESKSVSNPQSYSIKYDSAGNPLYAHKDSTVWIRKRARALWSNEVHLKDSTEPSLDLSTGDLLVVRQGWMYELSPREKSKGWVE